MGGWFGHTCVCLYTGRLTARTVHTSVLSRANVPTACPAWLCELTAKAYTVQKENTILVLPQRYFWPSRLLMGASGTPLGHVDHTLRITLQFCRCPGSDLCLPCPSMSSSAQNGASPPATPPAPHQPDNLRAGAPGSWEGREGPAHSSSSRSLPAGPGTVGVSTRTGTGTTPPGSFLRQRWTVSSFRQGHRMTVLWGHRGA